MSLQLLWLERSPTETAGCCELCCKSERVDCQSSSSHILLYSHSRAYETHRKRPCLFPHKFSNSPKCLSHATASTPPVIVSPCSPWVPSSPFDDLLRRAGLAVSLNSNEAIVYGFQGGEWKPEETLAEVNTILVVTHCPEIYSCTHGCPSSPL